VSRACRRIERPFQRSQVREPARTPVGLQLHFYDIPLDYSVLPW
jgi:hypothetical protein